MLGLTGKSQTELQGELNEQAAKTNYEWGEKAAKNAYERQLALYKMSKEDESYASRVADMKAAGLNPNLMYQNAGTGGGMGAMSSGSQGATGGATAGNAPTSTQKQALALQTAQQVAQMELLKAQAKAANADANESNANANKTTGVDTEYTIQALENLKKQKDGQELANEFQRIVNEVKNATKEDEIDRIQSEAAKAFEEALQAVNDTTLSDETLQARIAAAFATLAETNAKRALLESQQKLTEEEARLLSKRVEAEMIRAYAAADSAKAAQSQAENAVNALKQEKEIWNEKLDQQDKEFILGLLKSGYTTPAGMVGLTGQFDSKRAKRVLKGLETLRNKKEE